MGWFIFCLQWCVLSMFWVHMDLQVFPVPAGCLPTTHVQISRPKFHICWQLFCFHASVSFMQFHISLWVFMTMKSEFAWVLGSLKTQFLLISIRKQGSKSFACLSFSHPSYWFPEAHCCVKPVHRCLLLISGSWSVLHTRFQQKCKHWGCKSLSELFKAS